MKRRITRYAPSVLVAAIAALLAPATLAQTSSAIDALNIPEDINLLGSTDTNVRRATARVNGTLITGTDVAHRVALVLAANEGTQFSEEEMRQIRLRALRGLIDDTLKIQEATALEMEVTAEDVEQTYAGIASERFGGGIKELDDYLNGIGSSPASLKRQIEGEKAWENLMRRNIAPFVNVSTEEVSELYQRMQGSQGTAEYRIGEIYLSATPATQAAVAENANRIIDQLRQGGAFSDYARQFSEASTAAVGGDLGWIRLEQLQNPQLEAVATDMLPGQLVGPVPIPGGFSILYLVDKRHIGVADPRDALLSLTQVSIMFPPGTSEAEASQKAATFSEAVSRIRGCGDAADVAASIGAEVVANDQISVRSLPEALQSTLLELNVGQATPPFGSLEEGVRILLLCGRDDPEVESGPNMEQLRVQLEDDRITKRAQRYLRDLRRDAVIEYN